MTDYREDNLALVIGIIVRHAKNCEMMQKYYRHKGGFH